jgi:ABC transport system ATP-binding/permease protein
MAVMDGRIRPELREDVMTEATLHPADAATASRAPVRLGTGRAVGARMDAIGVGQHAGERQILHEVSLSIEPGELIAIAGGSGAGKTTLLEILAGAYQRPVARQ